MSETTNNTTDKVARMATRNRCEAGLDNAWTEGQPTALAGI